MSARNIDDQPPPPRSVERAVSLTLEHCPGCGYRLEGLPPEGICPECGGAYDQSAIVLHGWACGHHSNLGTSRPAAAVGWALFAVVALWFSTRQWNVINAVLVGWFVLNLAAMLLQRTETPHPGLVQVWLKHYGCWQVDDLSGRTVLKTVRDAYVLLAIVAGVAYLLFEFVGVAAGVAFVLLVVAVAAIVTFQRARGPGVNEGEADDVANAAYRSSGPGEGFRSWDDVEDVSIEPAREGHYRLRISGRPGKWWRMYIDPVDVEFRCTPEQARAIRERAARWIEDADADAGVIAKASARVSPPGKTR